MPYQEVYGGIKNLTNSPDIAFQFQENGSPWPSVAAAHNGVPAEYISIGKIRFIDLGDGKGFHEYWYKDGVTINDLVQRYENMDTAQEYQDTLESLRNEGQLFRDEALQYKTVTEINAQRAENAADAAIIQPDLYPTEPIGRAAVADGKTFLVEGIGVVAAFQYRRINNNASALLKAYPSIEAIAGIPLRIAINTDGKAYAFPGYDGDYSVAISMDGILEATDINVESMVAGKVDFKDLGNEQYSFRKTGQYEWAEVDLAGNVGYARKLDGKELKMFVPSPAAEPPNFGTDINHNLSYGQSNGQGHTTQPMSTINEFGSLMFQGGNITQEEVLGVPRSPTKYNSLVPFVETERETLQAGFIRVIMERLVAEDGVNLSEQDYKFLVSTPAMGGRAITALNKGNQNYINMLLDVSSAKLRANELGKSYSVASMCWTQGELETGTNMPVNTYAGHLKQLILDANADIKAITQQTWDLPFLFYQVACHAQVGDKYPNVALAQAQVAAEIPNALCTVPAYIFEYTDLVHLNGDSQKWMGAYSGLAFKRHVLSHFGFKPFKPFTLKRTTTQKNIIEAVFDVPYGKMVFDTSLVSDPGNYGFKVTNTSGVALTISSVTIVRTDAVRIIMAADVPAGARLTYGINVTSGIGRLTGPRGCLRDSQGDTIVFDPSGLNKPMHNWCLIFDKVIN